ncbi:MAG: hypothetical protein GY888_03880 [Planctomycetaceae bacterium]|nr:hypothetical protein [Planctomycetaceae bacterium]
MKERNKKQEPGQRRSLQIEKFEHRMVPAASIIPVDVIEVDVLEESISTPAHSAIEATEQLKQQGVLVNQLREGKGPRIWSDGTFTSVSEKRAPTVDDLWHDAIPEEDFGLRMADRANGITFPDDLGPPGIWDTGPVSSLVEASVVDQVRPRMLSSWLPCPPYEPVAAKVDQIFHDAGEPDMTLAGYGSWTPV